jgi:hypothetical protein
MLRKEPFSLELSQQLNTKVAGKGEFLIPKIALALA